VTDEIVRPDEVRVDQVEPDRIGLICACGWGMPSVEPFRLPELELELQKHIAARHPEASSYRSVLSVHPIERVRGR
jgi:hypothetical protein